MKTFLTLPSQEKYFLPLYIFDKPSSIIFRKRNKPNSTEFSRS